MAKAGDPITIGTLKLQNRMTMAPTVKFDYAGPDGMATDAHVRHYGERAAGGIGLICVEATAVTPGGRFWKNHMGLWEDAQIEGHKRIVSACHERDVPVIIQLNHTGITANPDCGPAMGPSAVTARETGKPAEEMSAAQIREMQESFLAASLRAKKAGYDGIQLHGCHGYLINQFISKKTNLRTDAYGGSVENRARFAAEIIRMIREECGEDFLISVRTAGIEPDVEAAIAIAEEYVRAGCDYLQVSTGIEWEDSSVADTEHYNRFCSLGVRFHEHFRGRVPVSCVNGILDPETVRYLIENDLTDTVDLARAVLADPAFPEAVLTGAPFKRCLECRSCQYGPGMPHKCPRQMVRK